MIDNGFSDISDHESFVNGVPHKTFERLRNEDPVHWTKEKNGRGFWSITLHSDILEINGNNQVFSSAQGIRIEDQTKEEYLARKTFQETDPPEHKITRKLLAPAFSQKAISKYEEMIRDLAKIIVNDAIKFKEFNAVEKIAKKLPMMMLGRILGLPDEDLEWLILKGDALIGNSDPEFTDHIVDKLQEDKYRYLPFRSPAALELYDYAEKILKSENIESIMNEHEFKNFFCLLIAAGNDTTRYSLAMSIYKISNNKILFDELRSNKFWLTAPDEFIRIASPTMYFRRTATSDYMINCKKIREGDKVILWFVSGNRDKLVFKDPHNVILSRNPNPHMAFGQGGVHFCLGIWLARLEVKVLLQELVNKIRYIKLIDNPTWTRSNFICGVKSLNVKIRI